MAAVQWDIQSGAKSLAHYPNLGKPEPKVYTGKKERQIKMRSVFSPICVY